MTDHLDAYPPGANTSAVARVLAHVSDQRVASDLLFLETWAEKPVPGSAAFLRVQQMHHAQQALLAEVRAEIMEQRHPGRAQTPT